MIQIPSSETFDAGAKSNLGDHPYALQGRVSDWSIVGLVHVSRGRSCRGVEQLKIWLVSLNAVEVLLHLTYKAMFNLFWHPLAGFPGSALRRASALPDALSTLKGTQYLKIQQLHAKYGHVVRIAPNSLSYSSAEAWTDIYALKADRSELAKDPLYYRRGFGAQLLNGSLMQHEPLLNSYFDLFVAKLKQRVGENVDSYVDLMAYFNFVTFDIIGCWADVCCTTICASFIRRQTKITHEVYPGESGQSPELSSGKSRPDRSCGVPHPIKAILPTYSHAEQISKNADSIEAVLKPEEVLANCRVLLTAGSETTATHLTGVTWLLMTHPDKLKRTQDEIRSNFRGPDDITLRSVDQIERLPYLNAVIQEGLRCYPSVPSILPRVTNPGGNNIAGRFVPGGVSVGIHHWSAYRHPDNFHLPNSFIPERWLPDAPPCFSTDVRDVLHPFHPGPRGCLGKGLAYYEIRSLLVRLLWHFDLELQPGNDRWMEMQKEHALWDKLSLWVKLRNRRID
nr:cytochrome p450 monooxygenase 1 [Quercus suber]